MNILISTGHPAQVHNFRLLKKELEDRGHKVFWLATNKDISKYLLNHYGIDYTLLVRPKNGSFLSKVKTMIENYKITRRVIKQNKIDFVVSRVNPPVVLASFLSGIKQIGLSDTETVGIYDEVFSRLVNSMFTATSFEKQLVKDQIRFKGNIELFYLHPKRFQPKESGWDILGIEKGTPYVVMRFVAWGAFHDKGHSGFSDEMKLNAIKEFSKYAKVFVSSEKQLSKEFAEYQIKIPFEKMHQVMKDATLFFGEGGSMCSEAAVLGIPTIFVSDFWCGNTNEEMKYGLLYSYKQDEKSQVESIRKGVEILSCGDLRDKWKIKWEDFMCDKIDVTSFFVWFIENYPKSVKIMEKNPNFQDKFK